MNKLIEFNVPGGTVVVESQEVATGSVVRGGGLGQLTEKVGKSLGDALSVIRPAAEAAMTACGELAILPDLVEVEFGVKFDLRIGHPGGTDCVEGHIAAEAERSRQQQIGEVELVTTKVRHVSLKEATNGAWKQIPESAEANACFLSSVRLPPQGLCQVTHQGTLERWAYNVSDIAGAGFTCTATCIWMGIRRKPQEPQ